MKLMPAEIFKVLGLETRVRIIELLKSRGPLGVKDISGTLGMTPAAASQHLKILRQAGLVRSERKGYWIPYSIEEEALEKCRLILNEICTCGCKGTGKFKDKALSTKPLASLVGYEKELKNELRAVRERIKEVEDRKKR